MAKIQSLYKDYFQKSRVFLYPALDIKKGVSVIPDEVYMQWTGVYTINDYKLCCLYYLRDDEDFRNFEKVKLKGNRLFHDFQYLTDDAGVYIFDFTSLNKDWDAVVNGKYSAISESQKKKIRNFVGTQSSAIPYIDSFLYPSRFFKIYAEIINVDIKLLKTVGELCSLPDMEKETLNISPIKIEIINKSS